MIKEVNIVAIDPGGHIGFAIISGPRKGVRIARAGTLVYDYAEVARLLADVRLVVAESFQATKVTAGPMQDTIKMIGFIQGYCQLNGIAFQLQPPGVRKGYVDEAKTLLKGKKGFTKHTIDALAHGLRFVESRKIGLVGFAEDFKITPYGDPFTYD